MMYEERDRDFVCTLLGLQIGNVNQRPVRGPAIGEVQAHSSCTGCKLGKKVQELYFQKERNLNHGKNKRVEELFSARQRCT